MIEETGIPSVSNTLAILEAAEQRIYAIRQGRAARGLTPISDVLIDVYDRLSELAASDSAIPGLSTGLRDLDRAISGLNKSDLILLAARPGMGKTSMALNILLEAGKKSGKNVAFFSLEMSREQLALRLISGECFVDNKKLVTGKLTEEDWEKVAVAADSLNKSKILIDDDSSVTVADINAKCRRVENLGLVGCNVYTRKNLEDAVAAIASNKVDVGPLISRVFDIEECAQAFQLLNSRDKSVAKVLFKLS